MTALRVPSAGHPVGTAVTGAQAALSGRGPAGRSSQPRVCHLTLITLLMVHIPHGRTLPLQKGRSTNFVRDPRPSKKNINLKHQAFSSSFFNSAIRFYCG